MGNNPTSEKYFYRCAFPRGRILTKLEDDLSIIVQLIMKNAHKKKGLFNKDFDEEYSSLRTLKKKTIKNHRTEMIKLYGLTLETPDGYIEPSKMCRVLSETQDFYLFFKLFSLK